MEITDIIRNFVSPDGVLKAYPAKYKMQFYVLYYLSTKFEDGRVYPESEVNDILTAWSRAADYATLRRGLCDCGFMTRENRLYTRVHWTLEDVGEYVAKHIG